MSQSWEELEAPVLRWALNHGGETGVLPYEGDEPFAPIPGLTKPQVADAIARLEEHGLIAGTSSATMGYQMWYRIRPTADGLRVLGEWPPAEAATMNVALSRILRALSGSEELSEPEQTAARRAAGTIASTSGDVDYPFDNTWQFTTAGSKPPPPLKPLRASVSRVTRRGRAVTFTVTVKAGKATVSALAVNGRKHARLRARRHGNRTVFTARLAPGRWTVTVSYKPAKGYQKVRSAHLTVRIPRGAR
jgi:hypothetical protein